MQISPLQWNVLMTGANQISFAEGENILTEGELNNFYYRLECGTLLVQKI